MPLCPGPDIWLEYAQYSIGGMGSPGGIDKVRSIFERAVMAVGLHMTKGQTVWEAYREFENAILSTVQVCVSISREYLSDGGGDTYNLIFLMMFVCERRVLFSLIKTYCCLAEYCIVWIIAVSFLYLSVHLMC